MATAIAAVTGGAVVGLLIAALVGVWVAIDAQKHEMAMPVLWGIGVFLVLIVFLPAYFIVRYRHDQRHPTPPPPMAPPAPPPSAPIPH